MGGVGSGKTTLVKLIVRLLKQDSGEILPNGAPEKFNLNNLRKMITFLNLLPCRTLGKYNRTWKKHII